MEIYHDMYVLQLYKFVWGYFQSYSIQWDKNISKMAEKIDDVGIFFPNWKNDDVIKKSAIMEKCNI